MILDYLLDIFLFIVVFILSSLNWNVYVVFVVLVTLLLIFKAIKKKPLFLLVLSNLLIVFLAQNSTALYFLSFLYFYVVLFANNLMPSNLIFKKRFKCSLMNRVITPIVEVAFPLFTLTYYIVAKVIPKLRLLCRRD